jgi:hypothetical protein
MASTRTAISCAASGPLHGKAIEEKSATTRRAEGTLYAPDSDDTLRAVYCGSFHCASSSNRRITPFLGQLIDSLSLLRHKLDYQARVAYASTMKSSRDLYTFLTAIACTLLLGLIASADARMNMRCRVVVPKEYRKPTPKPPPNGEPEPVRYKVAYEAFWWNCAAVRAENIHGRCPFMASGTPAASTGAMDGASDADSQIERLLQTHAASAVQNYLQSIASTRRAKERMRPYFAKPTPEPMN